MPDMLKVSPRYDMLLYRETSACWEIQLQSSIDMPGNHFLQLRQQSSPPGNG